MLNDTINQVISMVMAANRSMPAHFTSYKDRSQSFCIDSNLINTHDEYNMASESHRKVYDYLKDKAAGNGLVILKIGEDIMISSYIISKLESSKLVNDLKESLIKANIDLLEKDNLDFVNQLLKSLETQQYLDYCMEFGKNTALSK